MKPAPVIPEHIENLAVQIVENFVVVQKEGEEETHDIKTVRSFVNDDGHWEIRVII